MIDDLWLPTVQAGSSIFYSRRKNKKMRILTLTNDRNYQEINRLIENKITEKDNIIVWTYSLQKKFRLEAYTGCAVEGCCRYEDSASVASPLQDYLPFDTINLDFSSQNPTLENGRIEKEIKSLEETIKLQRERQEDKKGFVLIYTTLLNSHTIDKELVLRNSNDMQIQGINKFQNTITNQNEKMDFIEMVLEAIFLKYGYSSYKKNRKNYSISDAQKVVFSINTIACRRHA